jgi:hypothetical protein
MHRPDDQLLRVITLAGDFILPPPDPGYPSLAGRTGDWFVTTGTRG